MTSPSTLELGEFIRIPEWNIGGIVDNVEHVDIGADDDRLVSIAINPESEALGYETRTFRLSAGQFEVL